MFNTVATLVSALNDIKVAAVLPYVNNLLLSIVTHVIVNDDFFSKADLNLHKH